jgi:hypothetical protein
MIQAKKLADKQRKAIEKKRMDERRMGGIGSSSMQGMGGGSMPGMGGGHGASFESKSYLPEPVVESKRYIVLGMCKVHGASVLNLQFQGYRPQFRISSSWSWSAIGQQE